MENRIRVDVYDHAKEELDDIVDEIRGTKKEIASEALVEGIEKMRKEHDLEEEKDS